METKPLRKKKREGMTRVVRRRLPGVIVSIAVDQRLGFDDKERSTAPLVLRNSPAPFVDPSHSSPDIQSRMPLSTSSASTAPQHKSVEVQVVAPTRDLPSTAVAGAAIIMSRAQVVVGSEEAAAAWTLTRQGSCG